MNYKISALRPLAIALIAFLLCLIGNSPAYADAEMVLLAPVGQMAPMIQATMTSDSEEGVINQPANYEDFYSRIKFTAPIWNEENNDFSISGFSSVRAAQTNAILPDSNVKFPDKLWNIRVGPAYRHRFSNDYMLGFNVQGGSASDEPFTKFRNSEILANVFLRIPSREENAWIFLINYSSNREFLRHWPIPGAAYYVGKSKYMRGLIGIPFWIDLFPNKKIYFRATYLPIVDISTTIYGRVSKSVRLLTGFVWTNEVYSRNNRPKREDRLYYYEKKVFGGISIKPDPRAKITFKAGWAFDRYFFEGKYFWNSDFNRVSITDGIFATMELRLIIAPRKMIEKMMK